MNGRRVAMRALALVAIPDIPHYAIYREQREEAVRLAIEWFDEHLKAAPLR